MRESVLRTIQAGIAARLRVKDSAITVKYAESTYVGAPKGIIDESESLKAWWADGKQLRGSVDIRQPSSCFPEPVNVNEICNLIASKLKTVAA
jgi:hypothetical protein